MDRHIIRDLFGRSPRAAYLLGTPLVAAAYWAISLAMFGIVFGAGESSTRPSGISALILMVLGGIEFVLAFPFVYITQSARGLELSRAVFGGDSAAFVGLTGLSALFWAAASVWTYRFWLRRSARVTAGAQ